MAVEARAPCDDCNNKNNNSIQFFIYLRADSTAIIIIITDGNLTLTKRLIKKYCTYIIGVKKERVWLGGSRMGTKENKISKPGRPCSRECYEKNGNILLFRNIFALKF
jgi:hypothetical protein